MIFSRKLSPQEIHDSWMQTCNAMHNKNSMLVSIAYKNFAGKKLFPDTISTRIRYVTYDDFFIETSASSSPIKEKNTNIVNAEKALKIVEDLKNEFLKPDSELECVEFNVAVV